MYRLAEFWPSSTISTSIFVIQLAVTGNTVPWLLRGPVFCGGLPCFPVSSMCIEDT